MRPARSLLHADAVDGSLALERSDRVAGLLHRRPILSISLSLIFPSACAACLISAGDACSHQAFACSSSFFVGLATLFSCMRAHDRAADQEIACRRETQAHFVYKICVQALCLITFCSFDESGAPARSVDGVSAAVSVKVRAEQIAGFADRQDHVGVEDGAISCEQRLSQGDEAALLRRPAEQLYSAPSLWARI